MRSTIPIPLLRGLTDQQRRVVLYDDAGLTYAQISGKMHRSVNWVGIMLNHARRHLEARQGDVGWRARMLGQVEYLPKRVREVARLRLAGWSCLETARRLGISRITAARQWYQAQPLLYNLEGMMEDIPYNLEGAEPAAVAGQERLIARQPVSVPYFDDGEEVRPI